MEKFAPWNRQGSRARSSMSKTCVMTGLLRRYGRARNMVRAILATMPPGLYRREDAKMTQVD
jgi:hypothetical protein